MWEPTETAILTISTNSAYSRGSPYYAYIYIYDDDPAITNISFKPNGTTSSSNPTDLEYNYPVAVSFNYVTNRADGVRFRAIPYTNGQPTTNYVSPLTGVFYGSGTGSTTFSVAYYEYSVLVDRVQIRMYNSTGSTLLDTVNYFPIYWRFYEPIY